MKRSLFIALIALSALQISCNGTSQDEKNDKKPSSGLPYIGTHEFNLSAKNDPEAADTIYHTIPEFYLTAHDSSTFSSENVKGRIYVANFFFTTCPSICPAMMAQMKRLQEKTADIDEILFLSHTIDPKHDTIPQLRKFIKRHDIDTRNWYFLHGDQEYVYDLGKHGYMVNAMEDEKADGGFLHSEHFVLIDREGHIRGLYSGTDTGEVDQLEKDIRKLLATEYGE